ncbi:MAG: barstar family protein [Candidimonas sp.]|jgi:RNAse (barnase) inhibitor barstar
MSSEQTLQKKIRKGGLIDASVATQASLFQAAGGLGLSTFVVECDRARSRSAVLRAVVKAVDYPEFFGGNLEAFYDCLCDTILDQKQGAVLWFHNLHSGDPALEEDSRAILTICDDAAEFAANNDRIFSYAVEHAGRHPDPEPGIAPTPYSGGDEA